MNTQAGISDTANKQNLTVNRAFVVVDHPTITEVKDERTKKLVGWDIIPVLENSGNTPTVDMQKYEVDGLAKSVASCADTRKMKMADALDLPDPDAGTVALDKNRWVIGPHVKDRLNGFQLTPAEFKKIDKCDLPGVITGSIHYYDTFQHSKEHVTKFCYIIKAQRFSGRPHVPFAQECPHWNCADDECKEDQRNYNADVLSGRARQFPQ